MMVEEKNKSDKSTESNKQEVNKLRDGFIQLKSSVSHVASTSLRILVLSVQG